MYENVMMNWPLTWHHTHERVTYLPTSRVGSLSRRTRLFVSTSMFFKGGRLAWHMRQETGEDHSL